MVISQNGGCSKTPLKGWISNTFEHPTFWEMPIYTYTCAYIHIYICYIIYTQALIVKAWTEKDWIWKQTCLIAICFDKNVQKTLSLFTSSHPLFVNLLAHFQSSWMCFRFANPGKLGIEGGQLFVLLSGLPSDGMISWWQVHWKSTPQNIEK